MENNGNWHACPQLQITAGNIQVVCQEAGEEAWPWPFQMLEVNSPRCAILCRRASGVLPTQHLTVGYCDLPMQSFGFPLQMCFWRNLQSRINMLRLIGVHRLASSDCFDGSGWPSKILDPQC